MMNSRIADVTCATRLLTDQLARSIPESWTFEVDFIGGPIANTGVGMSRAPSATSDGHVLLRAEQHRVHFVRFSPPADSDGDLPCPECFDRRCVSWFTADSQWSLQRGDGRLEGPFRFLASAFAVQQAGLLARRIVESDAPHGAVYTLNLLTCEVLRSDLMADAFCNCAGPDDDARRGELALRSTLFALPGDMRMRMLRQIELPTSALVNPVCGAVGLSHISGFAQSITAPIFGLYWQRATASKPRSVGWSGLCLQRCDSERVGMIEALERQGGMQPPKDAAAKLATLRQLGDTALDPTPCLTYNEESYRLSLGLTRFGPDVPCNWIWGYSLARAEPVMVPAALAFYHRPGAAEVVKIVDNNSSGCAMGSCVEEALLKSFFELVERDSFVMTWLRELTLPKINPATTGDERIDRLVSRLDYLGIEISLLDARTDIDLPVIIAVARRRDQSIGAMAVGAAAHVNPIEAIRSAMLEAATSITELPAMVRHAEPQVRAMADDPYLVCTVMDHQMLYGLPEMAARTRWLDASPVVRSVAEAFPGWDSNARINIAAEIDGIRRKFAAVGLPEVVVVDMTAREQRMLGLRTVRAIVPGLLPLDFGHPRNRAEALPRLWRAPAAAGFPADRSKPLNPMAHPFP